MPMWRRNERPMNMYAAGSKLANAPTGGDLPALTAATESVVAVPLGKLPTDAVPAVESTVTDRPSIRPLMPRPGTERTRSRLALQAKQIGAIEERMTAGEAETRTLDERQQLESAEFAGQHRAMMGMTLIADLNVAKRCIDVYRQAARARPCGQK